MENLLKEDHYVTTISESHETTCWGCGLRLLLPSYTPVFKCGWCGAITNQNPWKHDKRCFSWWRRIRDWLFVSILILFMLLIICGGVWAVYPVIFSSSYFWGIFHLSITFILSVTTIANFGMAAFRCAGVPANVPWGNYSVVRKGGLENFTFCLYCSKPKSPRTHHCRSCGMCILDMDHHCPFIGNCVGVANHRHFIMFLISAIVSNMYAFFMALYAGYHVWPPLAYGPFDPFASFSSGVAKRAFKEIAQALLNSALLLSARGLALIYICIASLSVDIGLGLLLWQQLQFIYEGKTYINHISSWNGGTRERGCQNFSRFFGWRCQHPALRFLLGSSNATKKLKT